MNVSSVRWVRIVDVMRLLKASEFDTPAAVGGERSLQSIISLGADLGYNLVSIQSRTQVAGWALK